MQVTPEDLPHLKLPLRPAQTAGWPGAPTEKQMDLALQGLALMNIAQNHSGANSLIPALTPKEGRPQKLMAVEAPNGRTAQFDRYHELPMWISQQLIFNPRKVEHAWCLNMCIQAVTMQAAALETHRQLRLQTAEDLEWFLQTAAALGDSKETIGIAMRRPSPGGEEPELTFTKLMRHKAWMGYNPFLGNLKGMTFSLYAAHDNPSIPAQVIGRPTAGQPETARSTPLTITSKKMEKGLLNRILRHHGADHCLWVEYRDSPYAMS